MAGAAGVVVKSATAKVAPVDWDRRPRKYSAPASRRTARRLDVPPLDQPRDRRREQLHEHGRSAGAAEERLGEAAEDAGRVLLCTCRCAATRRFVEQM